MPDLLTRHPDYRDMVAQRGSERQLLGDYVKGRLHPDEEVTIELAARPEMIIATALGLIWRKPRG